MKKGKGRPTDRVVAGANATGASTPAPRHGRVPGHRNDWSSSTASLLHLFARRIVTFFIWFRHIAINFVTISLGLNRGSHYELVHTCLTKRTAVWLGSYNPQRAFNFGRDFSIVKIKCPFSIIWPKSNCGALCHLSVHLSRNTASRLIWGWRNKMRCAELKWKVLIRRAKWCSIHSGDIPMLVSSLTSGSSIGDCIDGALVVTNLWVVYGDRVDGLFKLRLLRVRVDNIDCHCGLGWEASRILQSKYIP